MISKTTPYWEIEVTLKYKDSIYILIDQAWENEYGEVDYMWERGNFSCDCNKSLFIQRQCDENFPEMSCGDEVVLISVSRLFKYTKGPVFLGVGIGWSEAVI